MMRQIQISRKYNMRLIVIVAALFGTVAHAGEYEDARDSAYQDAMAIAVIKGGTSTCAIVGTQVSNIMVSRLNGTAMSAQMAEPNLPFFQYVIRDAYKQPFYRTEDMRKQLLRDFRERYESECYETLGSAG